MHDTERLWLTFEITPEPFLLYVAYTNRDFKNMEDIKKTFNSFPITSSQHLIATLIEIAESEFSTLLTHENEFRFRANPDILQNNSIDLHALLNETIGYYRAYQELKEHKIIISSCDNTDNRDLQRFNRSDGHFYFQVNVRKARTDLQFS